MDLGRRAVGVDARPPQSLKNLIKIRSADVGGRRRRRSFFRSYWWPSAVKNFPIWPGMWHMRIRDRPITVRVRPSYSKRRALKIPRLLTIRTRQLTKIVFRMMGGGCLHLERHRLRSSDRLFMEPRNSSCD